MKSEDRFFSRFPKSVPGLLGLALVPLLAMPAGAAEAQAEEATSEYLERIEFRSMASLPGEILFSLHDPEEDRTFWIEINQRRNEIEAVSFDDETNRLTLRHGDAVREIGLSNRTAIRSNVEEDDGDNLSREERREAWRERRSERRAAWTEFRENWQAAVEEDPQIREIEEHREALREDWRNLRREMRDVERGSDEFRELRQQARSLREEQELLEEYGTQVVRNSSAFSEADADLAERMLQIRRRGGRGN